MHRPGLAAPWLVLLGLVLLAACASEPERAAGAGAAERAPDAPAAAPLRVFLRGGPKTHGPGEHEHELWVGEWTRELEARGAIVEGAARFPTEAELARADVLVIYAAEGGSIHGEERERLERFRARGGGLAVLHDGLCGDDPDWFKTVAGGAWRHGASGWWNGEVDLYFGASEHSITEGLRNFRFEDEIYHHLELDGEAQVVAQGFHTVFDVTPQAWVLERGGARSFAAVQGHLWTSFSNPAWRALVLRGIAWAGKRDVDRLLAREEVAALAYPPGGPTAPEAAADALVVHPDFEVSLAASEPAVAKPISIDWDARGRPWVVLTTGYPEKQRTSGRPASDEVAWLEDLDGDGRFETRRTFAGGLDLATSLVLYGGAGAGRDAGTGAIVSAAPEILWLRDRDGDGTCDAREVLYAGFGFGDTHAVVSNLRWGLDGWIYATQGYSGNASRDVRNAAGKSFGAIGNGLLRFRPDGSAIELVSAYGSNTWGLDFAEDGELFFTMANGAHLRHVVMPEQALAPARLQGVESWADVPDHDRVEPLVVRREAPYAQIDFVGGFTAASGCCIQTGGAWPDEWRGAHFVCEPTVNLVHHDALSAEGSTFRASKARAGEFLASRDLWFRPVHARVGPDGALYVLDFYNQAVVHNDTRGPPHGPTNAAVRPDRDHELGRIWRVQHREARPVAAAGLASGDPLQLAAALSSDNAWARLTAQRALIEDGGLRAVEALELALGAPDWRARLAALWALEELGPLAEDRLGELAGDPASAVAAAALRALTERSRSARALPSGERPGGRLLELTIERAAGAALASEHARVRLAAWTALATGGPSLARSEDLVTRWSRLEDDWQRSAALGVALAQGPSLWTTIAWRIAEPGVESLARELAPRALAGGDPAQARAVLDLAASRRPLSAGLRRELARALAERAGELGLAAEGLVARALEELLASADQELALCALELTDAWDRRDRLAPEVAALAERLGSVLADEGARADDRARALEALVARPASRAAALGHVPALLQPWQPAEVQERAVDALGALEGGDAAGALAAAIPAATSALRERILDRIAARPASVAVLLAEIEGGALDARLLGTRGIHRLRTYPDAELAARAARLVPAAASSAEIAALVERLLPEVESSGAPGDALRGQAVFAAQCAQCHRAGNEGGRVGPELTGIGARGAAELLPIILDPNRAVEPAYTEWIAHTTSNEVVAGVLARETPGAILLRWSAGEREIPRADLASLVDTGRSPMPAGFESLGAEALRDLLAFLAGGREGYRVIPLAEHARANSLVGMYDARRDRNPFVPIRFGIVDVEGVPFELLDPARTPAGGNVIVLKGGAVADWESKLLRPRSVEIGVGGAAGLALERVHVLGGIAGWGWPWTKEPLPVVRWTWRYADGASEEVVLENGDEFADWIGRFDVPGSTFVEGLLAPESAGQVRRFSLAPGRAEPVTAIVLESFDNQVAPTIVALTAELAGAGQPAPEPRPAPASAGTAAGVLLLGGGSSHDFARHWGTTDVATLRAAGIAGVRYAEDPGALASELPALRVLILAGNRPIPPGAAREAVMSFVEQGGGLLLLHAATWRNWDDWPEFNAELAGGGARSHEDYAEFDVTLTGEHPILAGVPPSFAVADELYRFELDAAAGSAVLATGRSRSSGSEYPVLWVSARGAGRIAGFTLGHDQAAHASEAYRALIQNAARWLAER